MTRNRNIRDVLDRVLEAFSLNLHVALPGVVQSYDAETQTADIVPGIQRVIPGDDEDEDEDTTESLPVLASVPVAFPRGGGYFLSMPLQPGDGVLVVFNEMDTDVWRSSDGEVVDPGTALRHGLSGGVAIPGMFTRSAALGSASGVYARLGRDVTGPLLDIRDGTIQVGGNVALAEAPNLQTHLSAIAAALDGIRATLAASVVGGPAVDPSYGQTIKAQLDQTAAIATTITQGT